MAAVLAILLITVFAACASGSSCGLYDGRAAAAYAHAWALTYCGRDDTCARDNHNPHYRYYGGLGGDCTSFASQALKAGGMRFMRTRGINTPNGNGKDLRNYMYGPGAWWSYYVDVPQWGTSFTVRHYDAPKSWTHSDDLFYQLLGYGLAEFSDRAHARPGDLVFYDEDLQEDSTFYKHTQVVTRVTHRAIWVAQHSWAYIRPLASVINGLNRPGYRLGTDWNYVILHPVRTAANIYPSYVS